MRTNPANLFSLVQLSEAPASSRGLCSRVGDCIRKVFEVIGDLFARLWCCMTCRAYVVQQKVDEVAVARTRIEEASAESKVDKKVVFGIVILVIAIAATVGLVTATGGVSLVGVQAELGTLAGLVSKMSQKQFEEVFGESVGGLYKTLCNPKKITPQALFEMKGAVSQFGNGVTKMKDELSEFGAKLKGFGLGAWFRDLRD